jgi:biopolymer transport protein ExbB
MQLSQLFVAAGIVAWPLLLFSILSLTLIAERSLFWFRIWKRQETTIQQALKRFPTDLNATIQLLRKNSDLPMARIFLEALELDRPNPEQFRLALEGAAQAELPILRRFSTVLDTIVTVSPLLGLLGTVLGLMSAFAGLGVGDVGGNKTAAVTGGISEAWNCFIGAIGNVNNRS